MKRREIPAASRQSLTGFDHKMRKCHRRDGENIMMSGSNSKGRFERACDEWASALIYMGGDLGRGGLNVCRVGMLMLMHTSRAMFFKDGDLVAFPSLERLAFMAGLNEKTVRRAIKELVKLGLMTVRHRFENSNLYYLSIPVAVEEHAKACLDLLSNRRHRARRTQKSPATQPESGTQMSGGVDNYAPETDVNVQGLSEDSLTDTLSLRDDFVVLGKDSD
jgi:hypothetical protein